MRIFGKKQKNCSGPYDYRNTMNENKLREKIDRLVNELIEGLKKELSSYLESITLMGSYALGQMSLQRPNVNILLFAKPSHPPKVYLKTGQTLYRVGRKYLSYFSFRVDIWPFRFAQPIGDKDLEVSVNVNIHDMALKNLEMQITPNKKIWTPFGAPEVMLQSFKPARKVVFGKDVLGEMAFKPSYEEILLGLVKELPLHKLMLTRAPFTYDIDEKNYLLATEALEAGKVCLMSLAIVLLGEEKVNQGKHLGLLADKDKLLDFLKKDSGPEVRNWAETILSARKNFLKVKKNKKKTLNLYKAAYEVINLSENFVQERLFG